MTWQNDSTVLIQVEQAKEWAEAERALRRRAEQALVGARSAASAIDGELQAVQTATAAERRMVSSGLQSEQQRRRQLKQHQLERQRLEQQQQRLEQQQQQQQQRKQKQQQQQQQQQQKQQRPPPPPRPDPAESTRGPCGHLHGYFLSI
jgi:hypothetical protein